MFKRILIIPREAEEQTLETVIALPLKVQIELALYIIDVKDLCNIMNTGKGFAKQDDVTTLDYKEVYEALIDKNNFIIPYVSRH